MSKEKEEKVASSKEVEEDLDGSDRCDFLKTTAKAAGAVAILSAVGKLMEDEAAAQEEEEMLETRPNPVLLRGLRMNVAKTDKRKQFGLSGKNLGQVLQNEGFIPGNIKNLEKAALHVSVSW
ncbi:hypothetical protein ACFL6S_21595 [Candidatus Poribacteria bacterium]